MNAANGTAGPRRCSACEGGGKCAECDGTGINVHLNEAEPKCRNCSGTGTCPTCRGTGRVLVHLPEALDVELNNL